MIVAKAEMPVLLWTSWVMPYSQLALWGYAVIVLMLGKSRLCHFLLAGKVDNSKGITSSVKVWGMQHVRSQSRLFPGTCSKDDGGSTSDAVLQPWPCSTGWRWYSLEMALRSSAQMQGQCCSLPSTCCYILWTPLRRSQQREIITCKTGLKSCM